MVLEWYTSQSPIRARLSDFQPSVRENTALKATAWDMPKSLALPKEEQLPIHPERKKNGVRRQVMILTTIFLLGLFAWQLYPFVADKLFTSGIGQQKDLFSSEDYGALHPIHERAPSIMVVEPQEMYSTFLRQYQLHPDTRFIKAFKILTKCFQDYQGKPLNQSVFSIGEVISNGKEIRIPLLKGNYKINEFIISLPMTFAETMSALNQCLKTVTENQSKPDITSLSNDDLSTLNNALTNINRVDPRTIMAGLIQLEGLWQKSGPHSQVLLTAVRAYTMLIMVLFPDRMDYTDDLAAHTVPFRRSDQTEFIK